MINALARTGFASPRRPRETNASARTIHLLESLIERIRECEPVFDLTHIARNGGETDDIVFIDDLSDVLTVNNSINELSADSASMALAARYSAMLKAALHILLQIRQLHADTATYRRE